VWKHQVSFASQFRLVFLDLAGHGKSGKNREIYTMELFAHDVKSVADKLNLRDIILLGHSMGGIVMLEAEKLLSERTIGLIAIDSLFPFPQGGYIGTPENAIPEIMKPMEENFIATISGLFDSMLTDKFTPQDIQMFKDIPASLDKRSMLSAYVELLKWDMHNILPDIEKPIKCITAGKTCPVEFRDEYSKLFDAIYIEELGHLLTVEDPVKFNKALNESIIELLNPSK